MLVLTYYAPCRELSYSACIEIPGGLYDGNARVGLILGERPVFWRCAGRGGVEAEGVSVLLEEGREG